MEDLVELRSMSMLAVPSALVKENRLERGVLVPLVSMRASIGEAVTDKASAATIKLTERCMVDLEQMYDRIEP
jgi:hypothetical protein